MGSALGVRAPDSPGIRIVIFESPGAARPILTDDADAGFAASLPHGDVVVAALGPGGAAKPERLRRLYVEAFLTGRAPFWYAQGMADLLSSVEIEGRSVLLGKAPRALGTWRKDAEADKKKALSMRELLDRDGFDETDAARQRRSAWLLTHYLVLASPDRARGLREVLRLWKEGTPSSEGFEHVFRRDPDALMREEVARYVRRGLRVARFHLPDLEGEASPAPRAAGRHEIRALLAELRSHAARQAAR